MDEDFKEENKEAYRSIRKRYAMRLEMRTLVKVLSYALKYGAQRKTNIATNCKMSYTRFMPFLNTMVLFGLLQIIDDPSRLVSITDVGKSVLEVLQNSLFE